MMEGLFGQLANQLVAVGYEQEKQLCKTLRFSPSRIMTIYNGVENRCLIRRPTWWHRFDNNRMILSS
jgi:hypothetical protein